MTATTATQGAGEGPSSSGKGLAKGQLGLFGSTIMGLASTAPVYSLVATLGFAKVWCAGRLSASADGNTVIVGTQWYDWATGDKIDRRARCR